MLLFFFSIIIYLLIQWMHLKIDWQRDGMYLFCSCPLVKKILLKPTLLFFHLSFDGVGKWMQQKTDILLSFLGTNWYFTFSLALVTHIYVCGCAPESMPIYKGDTNFWWLFSFQFNLLLFIILSFFIQTNNWVFYTYI
jgi:hypothetical protein